MQKKPTGTVGKSYLARVEDGHRIPPINGGPTGPPDHGCTIERCSRDRRRSSLVLGLCPSRRFEGLLFRFFIRTCHLLPRLWMQEPLDTKESVDEPSPSDSSRSSQRSARDVPRSVSAEDRAKARQNKRCAITEFMQIEVCRIFPRCLLSDDRPSPLRDSMPNFWDLIGMFFGDDVVREWRSALCRARSGFGCL